MSVAEMKNSRPPLFTYFLKPVEDRQATIDLNDGSVKMKDEEWVRVQQPGARDETEFPALQWINQMETESRYSEKRMPSRWVQLFKDEYRKWKAGEAMTVDGTSIKHATFLSPAEIANLLRIGVQSIEDGAAMNDEATRRYGLGGVPVKQKCQDWMKSRDSNKAAQEISQLRDQNQALEGQLKAQQEALDEMRAQLAVLNVAAKNQQAKRA